MGTLIIWPAMDDELGAFLSNVDIYEIPLKIPLHTPSELVTITLIASGQPLVLAKSHGRRRCIVSRATEHMRASCWTRPRVSQHTKPRLP